MNSKEDWLLSSTAQTMLEQVQAQTALREISLQLDEIQAQLWADERRMTGGGCL